MLHLELKIMLLLTQNQYLTARIWFHNCTYPFTTAHLVQNWSLKSSRWCMITVRCKKNILICEGHGSRDFVEAMEWQVRVAALTSPTITWRSPPIFTSTTVPPNRRSSPRRSRPPAPPPTSLHPARTTTSARGSCRGTSPARRRPPPPWSRSGRPASVDRRRPAFACCRRDVRRPSTSTRVRALNDATLFYRRRRRQRRRQRRSSSALAATRRVAPPSTCWLQRLTRCLPYSTTNWTSLLAPLMSSIQCPGADWLFKPSLAN